MRLPFTRRPKPTMSDKPVPKTIPIGTSIKVKMTRVVEDEIQGRDEKRRVITRQLAVRLKDTALHKGKRFFAVKIGNPSTEWGAFHLDPKFQDSEGCITYDENYCEPINPDTGECERNFEVSQVMANAFVAQGIKVATMLTGFIFTKKHVIIFVLPGIIAAMAVMSLNDVFHFVPLTEIHWVPSLPKVLPK